MVSQPFILINKISIFPRCYNATNNPLSEIREADVAVRQPKKRSKDEYQTDRFIILLLVLQISMFMVSILMIYFYVVSLMINFWMRFTNLLNPIALRKAKTQ